jgi:hypothetical protein
MPESMPDVIVRHFEKPDEIRRFPKGRLDAARMHRESLALWTGLMHARTGVRSGDTAQVFLYPSGEACSDAPILFCFVGSGDNARVISASSRCLEPR